jgi:hypothetical protein
MNDLDTGVAVGGGRMRISRTRGAASGFLLILLGAWGALIPFVGPNFGFAYTPDQEWTWTAARGWLEVLPGAATAVGGVLLLTSRNRAAAMLGGWLTVVAGGWFVVGRALAGPLGLGDPGAPVAITDTRRVLLELAYFSGLGAAIVFVGGLALGRLSVRSVRDVQHAHRPVAATGPSPKHARAEAEEPETEEPETKEPETEEPTTAEPRSQGFGGLFRSSASPSARTLTGR